MKEMLIHAIMFDMFAKSPVVILKEARGNRYLPILVGVFEASAIDIGLKKKLFPRPLTHDLINNIISQTEYSIEYIEINKIQDHTFYANIKLYSEGKNVIIDSRPSDAIALAVRGDIPILVDEEILQDAGVDLPEPMSGDPKLSGKEDIRFTTGEESRKFKEFINELDPEDLLDIDDPEEQPDD